MAELLTAAGASFNFSAMNGAFHICVWSHKHKQMHAEHEAGLGNTPTKVGTVWNLETTETEQKV